MHQLALLRLMARTGTHLTRLQTKNRAEVSPRRMTLGHQLNTLAGLRTWLKELVLVLYSATT